MPRPDALELLAACAREIGDDDRGYVALQTIPYRGHHLLAQAVLDVTRPGDRVFEGGVSSGYFARVLVKAGLEVDGHELDPLAADRAREVCRQVWVGDLSTFDTDQLDGPYQVLLFGDTLEHLPDPVAVLARLREHVRPDGALVISVPNVANWSVRLRLLSGHFDYADRGILDRTHLRFYTRKTLRAMVAAAGFEPVRMVASVPVPFVRDERVARATHRLGQLWPSLLGFSFVVTARPA